jgi:uncharacterized protein (TIGR00369 family)
LRAMKTRVADDDHCYCCGRQNSQGLHLSFRYPRPGSAETECSIPEHFTGWKNLTHGGFLAMLLDETMAHACLSEAGSGVTAELSVRYLKPVATGVRVRVEAVVKEKRARVLHTEGAIHDRSGELIARGSARFLKS